MKISRNILIIAIILGLATAFFLNQYLSNLDGTAAAREPEVDVVVANATIPAHTRISGEELDVQSFPSDAVHPEALRNSEEVVGGVTRSEIVRGEQVLASRVVTEDSRTTLSYRIPEDMRAISLPVNEVSGVSGYISPGDKLDILVTYAEEEINEGRSTTYTVFQNIKVLAAGETTQEMEDEERVMGGTVTLAVAPAQAEVIAHAVLNGSFHLTLRSPTDEAEVDLDSYSTSNFDDFRRR